MGVIFVFGNEDVPEDALALKVAKNLEHKHKFYHSSRPESLLEIPDNHITILDVAKGISDVKILDVGKLTNQPKTSLHDFDLGFFLRLITELDETKKFRIIAIPQTGNLDDISKKVDALLSQ